MVSIRFHSIKYLFLLLPVTVGVDFIKQPRFFMFVCDRELKSKVESERSDDAERATCPVCVDDVDESEDEVR